MAQGTCSVCGMSVQQLRRGMCEPHYRRWRRNGDAGAAEIKQPGAPGRLCSLLDSEPVHAQGYCQMHYRRWMKTGSTADPAPVTHCAANHEYTPENTYTDPQGKRHCRECQGVSRRASYRRAAGRQLICIISDCGRFQKPLARGWCGSHHARWFLYGDPLSGPQIREAVLPVAERRRRAAAYNRRYRAEHRAEVSAREATWRAANWEAVKSVNYRWRAANPDRWHSIVYAARDKRRLVIGAAAERVDYGRILATHGMACHICGAAIGSRADLHYDHVVPLARGGAHSEANIKPAHSSCNQRKGAKLMTELQDAAT